MADNEKNIKETTEIKEKLIDLWGKRYPKFECRYENSLLRVIADYGKGANESTEATGKILGAGYEPFIIAFFIGVYSGKRIPLSDETKGLGQAFKYWGNMDEKKARKANRKPYPTLRNYIFIACVAKTDIDWIALDKGDIKVETVVSKLVETMEEYSNYGFSVMEEYLKKDKAFFFSNRSFLDIFLELTKTPSTIEVEEELPEDI